jgi:hypothetical protein
VPIHRFGPKENPEMMVPLLEKLLEERNRERGFMEGETGGAEIPGASSLP